MKNKSATGHQRALILTLLAGSFIIIAAATAMADHGSKASGELLVAKDVTLNGKSASSGLTILSGSRLKTGPGGRVILNLGQLGRIKLGAETEIVLDFSAGAVGGNLLSGWTVVSAPKGIKIAVTTTDGIAAASGDLASVLTIDMTAGNTRVESLGAAKLISGQQTEAVAAGEELTLSRAANDQLPIFTRSPLGGGDAGATAETTGGGLMSLLTTSVKGSVDAITLNRSVQLNRINDRVTAKESSELRLGAKQQQQVSCPPDCPGCEIFPQLVKGKPRCVTFFKVSLENIPVTSIVSVGPFNSNACFRIFPGYPQQVQIAPGGVYNFDFDARLCPINAGKLPQNTHILIRTSTCGNRLVRIEWAPPCL